MNKNSNKNTEMAQNLPIRNNPETEYFKNNLKAHFQEKS